MRHSNFKRALLLTASIVIVAAAAAQTEASSECLGISVDTKSSRQLNAAISVCTRTLSRSDLSPETRTELLVHRGVAYRNVGNLDKSLADLGAARSLAPNDPWVSRLLAWTFRASGQFPEAETEYGRALKLEPHPQAFLSRCFVRYDMKKFEDALADCETAHGVDQSEDSTYLTALLYRRLGQLPSSLSLLEGVIGTSIESGRIYRLLAEIYNANGRSDDARRVRQQAQRKFPKDQGTMLAP